MRLAQALDRVRCLPAASRVIGTRERPTRFLVKSGESHIVVPETRVLFFASEGGLTRLISETGQYWMDPTLNDLEQRLDPSRFFRISRAALVSLNAAAEVRPLLGGSGKVVLKNGQHLEVSRRRLPDLMKALGGGT
ncbi:MAG TPA: LytTR family DNA-binding domain-containing protein [Bryobacteraceae bacterium]|nr:LytTR family DNA-binding domain-containing protein [Bryobacteraceae bacterium]